ncbi:hypothetical protein H0H93_014057 [Arthromyces matolae]|nr:hypothetical protein H0H93_014057 [Arthromyces matolae]
MPVYMAVLLMHDSTKDIYKLLEIRKLPEGCRLTAILDASLLFPVVFFQSILTPPLRHSVVIQAQDSYTPEGKQEYTPSFYEAMHEFRFIYRTQGLSQACKSLSNHTRAALTDTYGKIKRSSPATVVCIITYLVYVYRAQRIYMN